MSLLHEVTLERLWSKYENRYGSPPPITSASFDEAISLIRKELTDAPDDMDAAPAVRGYSAVFPKFGDWRRI